MKNKSVHGKERNELHKNPTQELTGRHLENERPSVHSDNKEGYYPGADIEGASKDGGYCNGSNVKDVLK